MAFYTVVPMDLDVIIRKDGELQAIKNLDVVCPVEGLNTIVTITPEGAAVKKNDVIAELDASDMKKKLQSALLDVKKAEVRLCRACRWLTVDLLAGKNVADIEAANVELKLAQIDLKAYNEGIYPQSLSAAQKDADMARITVQDAQQVHRMQSATKQRDSPRRPMFVKPRFIDVYTGRSGQKGNRSEMPG